jgi:hypothetical protein
MSDACMRRIKSLIHRDIGPMHRHGAALLSRCNQPTGADPLSHFRVNRLTTSRNHRVGGSDQRRPMRRTALLHRG